MDIHIITYPPRKLKLTLKYFGRYSIIKINPRIAVRGLRKGTVTGMETEKRKILALLEQNAKLTPSQLAAMLDMSEDEIRADIEQLEGDGIIKGYNALIDWERAGRESITALIEVRVTPQRDFGFEQIAERILQFDEVSSVYLMSGGFDFAVTVEGDSFKKVALFVAQRLSPLDNVLSTATHFVLRKYKDKGIVFGAKQEDERGKISLC